jgi:hypothetical protein
MGGACSTNGGEEEHLYAVGGKASLVYNIRVDLLELGWGDVDWFGLGSG